MKTAKAFVISAFLLIHSGLSAADEESELDFISTEEAFAAAEENKGWVMVYVDWGR